MIPPQYWYIHTYTHTPFTYKTLCKYFTHIYTEEDVNEEKSAKPGRAGYIPWIAFVTVSRCSLVSAKTSSTWRWFVRPVKRLCVLVWCFLSFCALISLALHHYMYKSTSQRLFGRKIFLRRSRHLGFQVGCSCAVIPWSVLFSMSRMVQPQVLLGTEQFFLKQLFSLIAKSPRSYRMNLSESMPHFHF